MRRTMALLTTVLFLSVVVGCGTTDGSSSDDAATTKTATTTDASAIGGETDTTIEHTVTTTTTTEWKTTTQKRTEFITICPTMPPNPTATVTASDDEKTGTTVGGSSVHTATTTTTTDRKTTVERTVRTTTPQTTSRKTTRGPCGGSVAHKEFKSVEELFDWIHNGEGIASLFRRAIQGLKLDHLLIIEAADEVFTLEYVRTFQRGSGWNAQVEYYFISEKGERVCLYVHLKDMHAPVGDIKKYVQSNNSDNAYLNHFKFSYRDITMPTTSSSAITTTVSATKTNGPHPPYTS